MDGDADATVEARIQTAYQYGQAYIIHYESSCVDWSIELMPKTETGPKFSNVVSAENETEAEFNTLFSAETETETENQ